MVPIEGPPNPIIIEGLKRAKILGSIVENEIKVQFPDLNFYSA